MKLAYPIFIKEHDSIHLVYIPDLEIYTEGKTMTDAIDMARDAIGLKGIAIEDDGERLPTASNYDSAMAKAKADADDIFDYSDGCLTLVDVDFAEYRRRMNTRMVRRNTTIPNWMNKEADRLKLNVSQILQEALAARIAKG